MQRPQADRNSVQFRATHGITVRVTDLPQDVDAETVKKVFAMHGEIVRFYMNPQSTYVITVIIITNWIVLVCCSCDYYS